MRLEVENGGVLPEEVRANLFSPFVRAGGSSGGAGLGLYIVEHIARAHGGTVCAESSDGTTLFRALLPRHFERPRSG